MRENMYIKYSKYNVYQKYSHIPLFIIKIKFFYEKFSYESMYY